MNSRVGRAVAIASILLVARQGIAADAPESIVSEVIQPFADGKKHAAVAVGIITPKGPQAFGFGTVKLAGKDMPPDEQTLFEIGSITKVFTGTLLAQLVLEKKIKLDEPVQPWLPADWKLPRRDERDITFLHLATHTSSLPVQPPWLGVIATLSGSGDDPYAKFDSAAVAKALAKIELETAIGAKVEYSNLGVGLLGHALAKADDAKNYEELVSRRILAPLGMSHTVIAMSDVNRKRYAPGHNSAGKPVSGWNFATLEACGGLRSSVHDMLRFLAAAMTPGGTPLNAALEFAQQPWRELPVKNVEIGLCWMRTRSKNGLTIWHNGGTGGYASFIGFRPKTGCGVVVLCNCDDRKVDELGLKILDRLGR